MVLEHKHVIIRAEVTNPPLEPDIDMMVVWVKRLITAIDMNLLSGPYVEYVDSSGNVGLTVVAIIETSHIAIHVWEEPEPALMQIDIYSCGPLNLDVVWEKLQCFKPVNIHYKFLDREHGLHELESGLRNSEEK